MYQDVQKVHNFLDHPPLDNVDYFEFGKNRDLTAPSKLDNVDNFEMVAKNSA